MPRKCLSKKCYLFRKKQFLEQIFEILKKVFYLNPAVLKLGVATLFRVTKCFLRINKVQLPNYLRFDVVCDNLGSRKFWKYLERVRDSGYKKFENPCLNLYTDKKRERGQKRKECKNLIHCQFPPWLLYRANSY